MDWTEDDRFMARLEEWCDSGRIAYGTLSKYMGALLASSCMVLHVSRRRITSYNVCYTKLLRRTSGTSASTIG